MSCPRARLAIFSVLVVLASGCSLSVADQEEGEQQGALRGPPSRTPSSTENLSAGERTRLVVVSRIRDAYRAAPRLERTAHPPGTTSFLDPTEPLYVMRAVPGLNAPYNTVHAVEEHRQMWPELTNAVPGVRSFTTLTFFYLQSTAAQSSRHGFAAWPEGTSDGEPRWFIEGDEIIDYLPQLGGPARPVYRLIELRPEERF